VKKLDPGASSFAKVTGAPPGGDFSKMPETIGGDMRPPMDGDGTQSGQHPSKTQSKTMRFFE
jgi:hypothetical protein